MSWSLSIDGAVGTLTYSNPPENRFPFASLRDLDAMLESIGRNEAISVVAMRSGVDGVFSAGAALEDIKALAGGQEPSAPFDWWMRTLLRLEELPQPTVAFVDGLAASGGATSPAGNKDRASITAIVVTQEGGAVCSSEGTSGASLG